jgi:hypothetical protein
VPSNFSFYCYVHCLRYFSGCFFTYMRDKKWLNHHGKSLWYSWYWVVWLRITSIGIIVVEINRQFWIVSSTLIVFNKHFYLENLNVNTFPVVIWRSTVCINWPLFHVSFLIRRNSCLLYLQYFHAIYWPNHQNVTA